MYSDRINQKAQDDRTVATVTISFNSVKVLPRQIDALLQQSRPLQEIIVVDNASCDGTREMLAKHYPQVKVIALPENVGAAGAWAAGLEYAIFQKRHDWVWSFDDDSVPAATALETLLRGYSELEAQNRHIGMVAPVPVHENTGTVYPPLFWDEGWSKPTPEVISRQYWFADLVILSGNLVRRDVVEKVGLPRAEFFMDFFDYEFCIRARSEGFKIAVVSDCRFQHRMGAARSVRLPGGARLWPDYPPWREYYNSRNLAYVAFRLYPSLGTKVFAFRHLLRHAAGVLFFGSIKVANLLRMAQGVLDGRRARLGIRFLPD